MVFASDAEAQPCFRCGKPTAALLATGGRVADSAQEAADLARLRSAGGRRAPS